MKLSNAIETTYSNQVHNPLITKGIISVSSNVELTKQEIESVNTALKLIHAASERGYDLPSSRHAHVFFIGQDSITIELEENVCGIYAPIIVYPVNKWREKKMGQDDIVVILLEEMCHFLWEIQDEYEVKQRVLSLVRIAIPEMTLERLYRRFSVPAPKQ